MTGWVNNYCVSFKDKDFIEIDENLKYSEEKFGVRCFCGRYKRISYLL